MTNDIANFSHLYSSNSCQNLAGPISLPRKRVIVPLFYVIRRFPHWKPRVSCQTCPFKHITIICINHPPLTCTYGFIVIKAPCTCVTQSAYLVTFIFSTHTLTTILNHLEFILVSKINKCFQSGWHTPHMDRNDRFGKGSYLFFYIFRIQAK